MGSLATVQNFENTLTRQSSAHQAPAATFAHFISGNEESER